MKVKIRKKFSHRQKILFVFLLCFAQLSISAQLKPDETVIKSTCNTARKAVGQSDFKKAAQFIKSCLEENPNKDTFEFSENLLLGAEIEYYLENDLQAEKYAVNAELLYNSLDAKKQKSPLFGVRLNRILADLKVEDEDYKSALNFYKEGLTILDSMSKILQADGGEPSRLKAKLLSGIAYIELKTGFYNDAINNLKSALEVVEDLKDDESTKAIILNDLGHLLNEQRSHQQAVIYLKQSAEISERLGDSRNLAMVQQNLAVAYRGIGDFKTSQKFFEKVQESAVKNKFIDLNAMGLQGIASLYQYNGEHQRVIEILQSALQETDSSVRRNEILWRLSSSQNQMGEKAKARINANECYEWATTNKNENMRYLCATNLGETYLPDSSVEAEKWFRTAIDITENLSQRVSGNEYGKVFFMQDKSIAYHKLLNLLVEKKQISEAFAVGEKLKSRVLREKSQNRKNGILNENALNIPNFPTDTIAVSFISTADECFVFAIKMGKIIKTVKLPVRENELRNKIKHYRESILNFNPTLKAEGKQLYELLLGEFEKEIAGSKRLIIVPDGALWELPFQALIDATSGKYLVEEHEIFYTPSLNLLTNQTLVQPKKKEQKFVAFANPVRKDSAALPEAEREANSIGKLYSSSSVFVRNEATKTNFLREAKQAGVLHIAVHGVVNSDNPFDSALLFTDISGDDGRLTVLDILKIDLSGSLLVLSSCDTSSGRVINGEGLLSLTWAFLASGGKDVVAAQWAVEEKATADLMLNFYRTLKTAPNETSNALRTAQLKALKNSAPFNHPFYWAGFVSVGGPHR